MPAALRGYTATCRARSASRRMKRFKQIEDAVFAQAVIPPDRWPALIDILNHGKKTDKNRAAALKRSDRSNRPAKRAHIISIFFKTDGDAAARCRHKCNHDRFPADRASNLMTEQRRLDCPARATARRHAARPHRCAHHYRRHRAGALSRREGTARAARFRRSDRQDAQPAGAGRIRRGCTTSSISASTIC